MLLPMQCVAWSKPVSVLSSKHCGRLHDAAMTTRHAVYLPATCNNTIYQFKAPPVQTPSSPAASFQALQGGAVCVPLYRLPVTVQRNNLPTPNPHTVCIPAVLTVPGTDNRSPHNSRNSQGALWNLATNVANRVAAAQAGGIQPLVDLLRSPDVQCAMPALR